MKVVKSLLTSEKNIDLYNVIIDKYNIFNKYAETAIDLKRNKSMNDVLNYIDQNPSVNTDVVKSSQDLITSAEQLMKDDQLKSENIIANSTKTIIIVLIVIILICVAITIFLTFSISMPILSLEKQTNLIASGDLTASHVLIENKDEIGSLANAYNQMINSLKDVVNRVATKAEDVAVASEQLSATAQQTAASATETASTVSEVVQTVEQVSTNAQTVADESQNVASHAAAGWDSIEKITKQMEDIQQSTKAILDVINKLNDKSNEINRIVELITQISDQTNLLALNAAIEAARAGDAGRGFAVVAEEVRKLAEQSNSAAKDISNLIQAIQTESSGAVVIADKGSESVKHGTNVIMEVGKSFKYIIDSVQNLSGEIKEVASSTVEMSKGMQNIAAVSEEQTAVMEEISASSQTMANTAKS